ncbi:MAG: outer membrane protein assembly factor BamD [Acetobacteraceae bacterium]|nr:outer membrane protein assembly factor BamD [Acetobacteraceae bacterium]
MLRPAFAALLLLLALPLGGCETMSSLNPFSSKEPNPDEISVPEAEVLYNRGVDALNSKRYNTAATQFDQVEQNYPYSAWAVNAQLMQGYAEYLQSKYVSAIATLDRFIQLHPAHRDISYAYYLRALSYYEQIADVERDQNATREAMGALQEVVNRFPDSAYGRDARLKIDLARDHLAGKEMEIGRYYLRQKLYTAAINRFQRVVDEYQTTNHTAEALHRLTEIYLLLGLTDQAKKTAAVLGYNYPGSEWYSDSYAQLVAAGDVADDGTTPRPERPGLLRRMWRSVF